MLISRNFNIEEALQQRINERAETERSKDWKTALYAGILENREFITYLNHLCPRRSVIQNHNEEAEFVL